MIKNNGTSTEATLFEIQKADKLNNPTEKDRKLTKSSILPLITKNKSNKQLVQ